MKSKEKTVKQILSLVLAIFMITALPISVIASAETIEGPSIAVGSNGGELFYTQDSFFGNPRAGERALFEYVNGKPAYCIEPNAKLDIAEDSFFGSTDWSNIAAIASEKLVAAGEKRVTGDEISRAIALTMCYGSPQSNDKLVGNHDEQMIATQIIIWELCVGYRTCRSGNFHLVYANLRDIAETIREGGASSNYPYNTNVKKNYDIIARSLYDYYRTPSFVNEKSFSTDVTLTKNGNVYEAELTDTNNVLYQTKFAQTTQTATNGGKTVTVKLSINGKKLKITSDGAISGTVSFRGQKIVPNGITDPDGVLKYEKDGSQTLVGGTPGADPVNFTLRVSTDSDFNLAIVKKDKTTGNVIASSGFAFQIYDITSGSEQLVYGTSPSGSRISTFYTDGSGKAAVNASLSAGHTYKIKEVAAVNNYLIGEDVTFTYDGSTGVTIKKDYYDEQDKGSLHITKYGGDFSFSSGEQVTDGYGRKLYVDSNGAFKTINTGDPLKETVLTLNYDKLTAARTTFKIYADEDITVNGEVVSVKDAKQVDDTIVYSAGSELKLTKGTLVPQLNEDGTLYLNDGAPVYSYRTLANGASAGELTVNDLYFGTYRVSEVDPPLNYVASADRIIEISKEDPEIDLIDDPDSINNDHPVVDLRVDNSIGLVQFYLNKYLKPDELGTIDTREEYKYVKYGLFLDQAIQNNGITYTRGTLVGVATASRSGKVTFPNTYPAGRYYVQELCTSNKYKLDTKKYEVVITEGGTSNFHYGIENPNADQSETHSGTAPFTNEVWELPVNFKKVDSDTGKPLAGAELVLYRQDTDTQERIEFYRGTSDANGMFTGIPKLITGTYWYGEAKAPNGYIAESGTTSFYVNAQSDIITFFTANGTRTVFSSDEWGIENENKKGSLEISKYGSRFTTVETKSQGDVTYYAPVYMNGSLAGAGFTLYAAEDIVTPDGTKRYSKGDKVGGEKKTDSNGKLTFDDLFLGKYTLKETSVPVPYLNTFKDKTISITENGLTVSESVTNDKGTVNVTVNKTVKDAAELDYVPFDLPTEIKKVAFALYANDKITADDGSYIPKDGLIARKNCDENGNLSFDVDLPVGKYYVKEVACSSYFKLDESKHEFEVQNKSEAVQSFSFSVDNPSSHPYTFIKRSEAELNVNNAVIGIYANGNEIMRVKTRKDRKLVDVSDNSVIDSVKLPVGTYTYKELDAPSGYEIDTKTYTINVTADDTALHTFTIIDKYTKGSIEIDKYGDLFKRVENSQNRYLPIFESGNLSGAVFRLIAKEDIKTPDGVLRFSKGDIITDSNGQEIKLITNSDGKAKVSDLYLGSYYIEEIEAPDGYELIDGYLTAEVTATNSSIAVTAEDVKKTVSVELYKALKAPEIDMLGVDLKEEIKKVEFSLYANEEIRALNGDVIPKDGLIEKAGCDENGTAVFSIDLPFGSYYVKETSTSSYYKIDDEKHKFTVDKDSNETIKLNENTPYINNPKEYYVNVKKVASDTQQPLQNATIGIFRADGLVLYRGTTNESGLLFSYKGLKLTAGDYYYQELAAPSGYEFDDTKHDFTISTNEPSGKTFELLLEDRIIMGRISINKYGKIFATVETSDTAYSPQYFDSFLNGAVFGIYADGDIVTPDGTLRHHDGDEIERLETVADGSVTSGEMYLGKYIIKELKAPYGYELSDEIVRVTLTDKRAFFDVNYKNRKNIVTAKLIKTMELDETGLINAKDEILNVSFGLYAGEDITAYDGSTIPKDGLIEKQYCNADGEIIFMQELPDGEYYVKETSTSEYYKLDDTIHTFTVTNYESKQLDLNEMYRFVNELYRSTIVMKKVDSKTGESLAGAKIEIRNEKGSVVYTGTSDENGMFTDTPDTPDSAETSDHPTAPKLPKGTYTYCELEAPDGYVLDTKIYTFEVTGEEENIDIVIENTRATGGIEITKTDIATDETLPNCKIRIYDKDGNVIVEKITDGNGKVVFDKLPTGKYSYQEVEAPDGYLINEELFPFEITEDGQIIKAELKDKRAVGGIEITKTDIATDETLPNCKIRIYDEDGNIIVEKITDENGKVVFDELPTGKYSYQELEAPAGYLINEELFPFEITEDGQIIKAELKDKRAVGGIEITKTDIATDETLPNCKIRIYDEDGNIIVEKITDGNGKVVFDKLPTGKYSYQELEAPDGYLINEELFPFEITENGQIIKAELKDKRAVGSIEITKTDIATDETLPNCKIRIYDEDGNIIVEKITDENGKVVFDELTTGKYSYQELEAPDGYLIDTALYPFEITEDGQLIKAILKDRKDETDTDTESDTDTDTDTETDTDTTTDTDTETDTDTTTDTDTETDTDTTTDTDTETDTDTTTDTDTETDTDTTTDTDTETDTDTTTDTDTETDTDTTTDTDTETDTDTTTDTDTETDTDTTTDTDTETDTDTTTDTDTSTDTDTPHSPKTGEYVKAEMYVVVFTILISAVFVFVARRKLVDNEE